MQQQIWKGRCPAVDTFSITPLLSLSLDTLNLWKKLRIPCWLWQEVRKGRRGVNLANPDADPLQRCQAPGEESVLCWRPEPPAPLAGEPAAGAAPGTAHAPQAEVGSDCCHQQPSRCHCPQPGALQSGHVPATLQPAEAPHGDERPAGPHRRPAPGARHCRHEVPLRWNCLSCPEPSLSHPRGRPGSRPGPGPQRNCHESLWKCHGSNLRPATRGGGSQQAGCFHIYSCRGLLWVQQAKRCHCHFSGIRLGGGTVQPAQLSCWWHPHCHVSSRAPLRGSLWGSQPAAARGGSDISQGVLRGSSTAWGSTGLPQRPTHGLPSERRSRPCLTWQQYKQPVGKYP